MRLPKNSDLKTLQVAKSATGKMYKRGTFEHLALHSGVVVCLEVLLNLERTCCYNDGGRPTAEVDRQILQTTCWCFIPKGGGAERAGKRRRIFVR